MTTNIRDVAKAAGVSVATVSKVLNGYTTVNQQTKEKVLRIVKETRFTPNSAARSLVGRRSMTIGMFLTTGLAHPFFAHILSGMEQSLKTMGYDLIYLTQIQWAKEYSFVRHCQSRNVEGVVVFGFQEDDADFSELIASGIPTLFIDLDVKGERTGFISSDNETSLLEAVRYLANLNHRRIAFLSAIESTYVTRQRLRGYKHGLAEAGIAFDPSYVVPSDFTKEGGYVAMRRLLELPARPSAVICSSDVGAIGAMEAIREAGLTVPDDISLIGFDDIELAVHMQPPLTTVRQDTNTIGRQAIELLDAMITDELKPPPEAIVPTELIIRGSCGPARR